MATTNPANTDDNESEQAPIKKAKGIIVSLVCKDGEKIDVDHNLLVTKSSFFRALFGEGGVWKENEDGCIEVAWEKRIVQKALEGLKVKRSEYLGHPDIVTSQNIVDLLEMATYYDMKDLTTCCLDTMTCCIDSSNVLRLLRISCRSNIYGVVHECLTFCRRNALILLTDAEYIAEYSSLLKDQEAQLPAFRMVNYLKGNVHRGTEYSGDPAMYVGACTGCRWCKACPSASAVPTPIN